ncbi:hypothetical protein HRbin10_01135 [bacterium HR10]|nr:hypothetical protein HRbin10_01135 [bacterium HR10]
MYDGRRWSQTLGLHLWVGGLLIVLLAGVRADSGSAGLVRTARDREGTKSLESNARSGSSPVMLAGDASERESPLDRGILGEVIMVGDGVVRLNGVPAFWGSAVLDGSDIETTSSMAFVRLHEGRGVIFIGPASRVRLSRAGSTLRLRVLYGEATVRSHDDIEVEGPERSLRLSLTSDRQMLRGAQARDALYGIFAREGAMVIRPLNEEARFVQALRAVPPEVARAIAVLPFQHVDERARVGYAPGPMPAPETTERPPLVIQCRAEKLFGRGLRVVGRVAVGTTPIGGAPVIVRVLFRSRLPGLTVLNVVTGADGPFLGYYQAVLAATPADLAAGGIVEVVTQVGREIAGNRCGF